MTTRIKIKICGITRREDALAAHRLGADAIGLVFYAPSPRSITPEKAAELVRTLPPFLTVVGLFVNAQQETIRRVVDLCHLNVVQLHGDETPEFCRNLDLPAKIIKAIRVQRREDLAALDRYPVHGLLLDAKVSGQYGGTGRTFDWSIPVDHAFRPNLPILLAGGLTSDNVAEAARIVAPYAVDVSSGVEKRPGIKDISKMAHFIHQTHRQRLP